MPTACASPCAPPARRPAEGTLGSCSALPPFPLSPPPASSPRRGPAALVPGPALPPSTYQLVAQARGSLTPAPPPPVRSCSTRGSVSLATASQEPTSAPHGTHSSFGPNSSLKKKKLSPLLLGTSVVFNLCRLTVAHLAPGACALHTRRSPSCCRDPVGQVPADTTPPATRAASWAADRCLRWPPAARRQAHLAHAPLARTDAPHRRGRLSSRPTKSRPAMGFGVPACRSD